MHHCIAALVLEQLSPAGPRRFLCRLLRNQKETWWDLIWHLQYPLQLCLYCIRKTGDSCSHTWCHTVIWWPHHECSQGMQLPISSPFLHSSECNVRYCKNHVLQYYQQPDWLLQCNVGDATGKVLNCIQRVRSEQLGLGDFDVVICNLHHWPQISWSTSWASLAASSGQNRIQSGIAALQRLQTRTANLPVIATGTVYTDILSTLVVARLADYIPQSKTKTVVYRFSSAAPHVWNNFPATVRVALASVHCDHTLRHTCTFSASSDHVICSCFCSSRNSRT